MLFLENLETIDEEERIWTCKHITKRDTVANKFKHRKTCYEQVKNPRPTY